MQAVPGTEHPEILVVDDSPTSLQLLTAILASRGYRVRPLPDGETALRSVAAKLPDLILLDVNMPEIDGYEVCRRLKSDRHTRELPVIFISATSETETKIKGFKAGCVDFITKPFDEEEVVARVHTHLSLYHLQRQLVAQNLKLQQEIQERRQIESLLQKSQAELEDRVAARTRELSQINTRLQAEIEERRRLEDQYIQAQKMEAIGKLTGGVAHDFNNILTIIMGVNDLMRFQQPQGSPLLPRLNQIHEATTRAADLVHQLLAFSRQQVMQAIRLDLGAVVSNFEKMLGRLIGEDIQMVTMLEPKLAMVKADPGQIEQVLMNLAVNARDAMPNGGKLTIETANKVFDETYTHHHMGMLPGAYVMLAVSDTGVGMNAQTRARIFEPFFTTKAKGEGTGLGLSTVYGIVNQSGGHIWVYSEFGQGSCFKIYLPQSEPLAEEPTLQQQNGAARGGSETILLVEDDDIVRALAEDILTNYGYSVLSADHARAADAILAAHQGSVDLMLTDVIIPGEESGAQLAKRLCAQNPHLKVLFMSGYTDNAIVHHGVLDTDIAFIQKPFMPNDLARKVRETLDN